MRLLMLQDIVVIPIQFFALSFDQVVTVVRGYLAWVLMMSLVEVLRVVVGGNYVGAIMVDSRGTGGEDVVAHLSTVVSRVLETWGKSVDAFFYIVFF